MYGIKGWIEGLSTHIWLRASINGLGVSKKMRKILSNRMQSGSDDYILPWKAIKEELANPHGNVLLNAQYLLEYCYVKDEKMFMWLEVVRGIDWDLKYTAKRALNPSL